MQHKLSLYVHTGRELLAINVLSNLNVSFDVFLILEMKSETIYQRIFYHGNF